MFRIPTHPRAHVLRPRSSTTLLAGLAVCGALLAGSGCASKKVIETPPAPPPPPPAPNVIEAVEANPWLVEAGKPVALALRGTADRTAAVALVGIDGAANGGSRSVALAQGAAGSYTGSVSDLAAGRYRLEATLSGGPVEAARLVASRSLVVTAPPAGPTPQELEARKRIQACEDLRALAAKPGIYFDYDRSEIDAVGAAWIGRLATSLAAAGPAASRVTIEGHCDERGTINYNLALGQRRANAVKDALKAQGAAVAIEAISLGKNRPAVENATTEAQHRENRRAVVLVDCTPAR